MAQSRSFRDITSSMGGRGWPHCDLCRPRVLLADPPNEAASMRALVLSVDGRARRSGASYSFTQAPGGPWHCSHHTLSTKCRSCLGPLPFLQSKPGPETGKTQKTNGIKFIHSTGGHGQTHNSKRYTWDVKKISVQHPLHRTTNRQTSSDLHIVKLLAVFSHPVVIY